MIHNPPLLALSYKEAYVPLVHRNPLSNLVTALPYIDEETDTATNVAINAMIESEMNQMDRHKNYLESLPQPKLSLLESPEFAAEIERIKSDKEIIMKLMKKYELDDNVPLEKLGDPAVWRKLVEHLAILHQHNNVKYCAFFDFR